MLNLEINTKQKIIEFFNKHITEFGTRELIIMGNENCINAIKNIIDFKKEFEFNNDNFFINNKLFENYNYILILPKNIMNINNYKIPYKNYEDY